MVYGFGLGREEINSKVKWWMTMGWTTDELGREEINEKSKLHSQYHSHQHHYHGLGRERLTGKRPSPTKKVYDQTTQPDPEPSSIRIVHGPTRILYWDFIYSILATNVPRFYT